MLRLAAAVLAISGIILPACASADDGSTVQLVTAEDLAGIFPAAIDSFTAVSDTTYRGYWDKEGGRAALQIVARTYTSAGGHSIAINLATFDDGEQFMSLYRDGAVRDSTEERETYSILLGRLTLIDPNRAVEVKGFDPATLRAALEEIDFDRFASLPTAPIQFDSTFVRQGG